MKATSPFSRNQRLLTQSLSFPSRGVCSDVLNKSIEVYPVKREVKHAQRNGTRSQASGGPATSTSRLTHPNRPASIGLHSKEANTIGGTSGRQTSLASMPSIRCSVVSFFWPYVPFMLPLLLYFMLKCVLCCVSLGSLVL